MKFKLIAILTTVFVATSFMSFNTSATVGELIDWDTGIPVEGTYATVHLGWIVEGCIPVMGATNVEITYRHTTPPSARPGGFGPILTVTGYCEPSPTAPGGCLWHGEITFDSWINPSATRGVNHGDITISWPGHGVEYSWSFNVRHRA